MPFNFYLTIELNIIRSKMSLTIEGLEKAEDHSGNENYLQHIPAKIDYEGPANVKSFFTNFTENNDKDPNTPLFNAFRGRPLNGKKLTKISGRGKS